jgi:MFS family permease
LNGPIGRFGERVTPAFSYASFRRLWAATMTSMMGFWMLSVTQGWLVLELTESPFMLGVLAFFRSVPMLLLSPFGGVLADKVRRTRLLIVAQVLMGTADLTIGILVWLELVDWWHLAVSGMMLGSSFALTSPARNALVSDLVPRRMVSNGVALMATTMNASRVIGPTVAGFMIGLVGIAGTYFTQVSAYLLASFNIVRIRVDRPPPGYQGSAWSAVREGFGYVWRRPTLLALMLLGTSPAIFSMPMVMLLPALVKQDLGAGPAELGVLLGLLGVGAVAGSVSVVAFSGFKHKGAAVMLAALLDGVMVMLLGFSQSLVGAAVALALMGIFQAVYMAMIQTILQLMVPNRLRGRVLSIWMLGWGLTPVGLLPMSALAEAISTPFAMVLSGGIGVAVALAVMVFARQLWTLDPEMAVEEMEEAETAEAPGG